MKSQFLESELELYVQRLLIHEFYSTDNIYRFLKISPADERLKGYDAKIVGMTPFYCQFKTSDFLTRGALYKRRSAYFESKNWPISPFYSFALRVPNNSRDKTNPEVWQHNVLHALWKKHPSAVAYVAPAFHTRTEMDLLEWRPPNGYCIFHNRHFPHSGISIKEVSLNGHDRFRLPIFDGLVSIPPHVPVTHLEHSYAFTSYRDVTFHSEPMLVEGARTFSNAIVEFASSSLDRQNDSWPRRISVNSVRDMLGEIGDKADFISSFINYGLIQASIEMPAASSAEESFGELTYIQQHVVLAASLKAYFGITTFGLLKVEDEK